ncbi:unnamed protein product [Heterosigma akashiwo]
MSESALKKVEEDIARLEAEAEIRKDADKASEAGVKIVDYINKTDEPFSTGYSEQNLWYQTGKKGGCSVM